MNLFDCELEDRLAALRQEGLYRHLRRVESPQSSHVEIAGRSLLNFSSNDYLGLANHPALTTAAQSAINRYGAGAGASRLICGSLGVFHELDEAIAAFKGTSAALSFSSGYAAALGTICALMGKEDIIVLDRLVHACIVDGARLSGARLRVFAHNDLNNLKEILEWASNKPRREQNSSIPHVLVVTESIFSMDGDQAPLREIVELKEKYGAWLMVDEAHAVGIYGEKRRGLAEAIGVSECIEIQMGTLGKALGAAGGYICGSRSLVDYLLNRARSFVFSTAPVPAAAAAATAGIRLVQSEEGCERATTLWKNATNFRSNFSSTGSFGNASRRQNLPGSPLGQASAIVPLLIGDERRATEFAALLQENGFLIPAIRYPTVARGKARLRLTLTAGHTPGDLYALLNALKALEFQATEIGP